MSRSAGGDFGPNIYPQDRALNRGWSADGRRYRALEREAAALPGTLFFGRLIYGEDSDFYLTPPALPGWGWCSTT